MSNSQVNTKAILRHAASLACIRVIELAIDDIGVIGISNISDAALRALAPIITIESLFYALDAMLAVVEIDISAKRANNNPRVISTALASGVLLSLPSIASFVFSKHILGYIGYDASSAEYAQHYTRPFAWGVIPAYISRVLSNAGFSLEDTEWSTYALGFPGIVIGNGLGLCLSYGWLGLPKLGIAGFGWGYSAQYILDASMLILGLLTLKSYQALNLYQLSLPSWCEIKDFLNRGFKNAVYIQSSTLTLTWLSYLAARYGDSNIQTGLAIGITLLNLQDAFFQGIYDSCSTKLGDIVPTSVINRYRLAKTYTITGYFSLLCAGMICTLSYALAGILAQLLGYFNQTSSQEIHTSATHAIKLFSIAQAGNAIKHINTSYLRSIGYENLAPFISVLSLCLIGAGSAWLMAAKNTPFSETIDNIGCGFVIGIMLATLTTSLMAGKNANEARIKQSTKMSQLAGANP